MRGLTEKQKEIMNFIQRFSEKENMAPTVYEIANHFKIKTSTVFAHIKALQKKDFLTRSSKARSIALKHPKKQPRHMSFSLPIPLLGRINAGMPTDATEYREDMLHFDKRLIGDANPSNVFALRVTGESMRDLGILDSDIVIVKQTNQAKKGDVVVALVDNESTVKSFYPLPKGQIELRPANSDFKTQIYPAEEVSIQGLVIGLQRAY